MVVLMTLIFLVLAAPYLLQYFNQGKAMDLKAFNKDVALLQAAKRGQSNYDDSNPDLDKKDNHPVMFVFNPNNLPVEQWKKLGLSQRQINGIKKYEAKGGHYDVKADVQKMYTITPEDYARLAPYINLPDGAVKGQKTGAIVEINTADSAKLTELRGIGPSFAQRIIKYRTELGGFYNKQQLKEIYGIDSAKYNEIVKQITINPKKITGININNATVDDLRHFPYWNFKQMNAIVEYRKQHGNYHSVNDLHDIAILNEEILRKIAPYLVFK